jgi:CBS-domain-containing membrane protein
MFNRISGYFAAVAREFKGLWKNYFYQSLLAALVILVVFWILTTREAVVVASIGATAFIVFTMPKSVVAQPSRVIGGHVTGLVCGALGAYILQLWTIQPAIAYSITIGLSIFLLVALDFEHPPACGTALGVAINGFSVKVLVAVVISAVALSLVHHFMKKYLKDLV